MVGGCLQALGERARWFRECLLHGHALFPENPCSAPFSISTARCQLPERMLDRNLVLALWLQVEPSSSRAIWSLAGGRKSTLQVTQGHADVGEEVAALT